MFRSILLTLLAGLIITGCSRGETREGHLIAVMVHIGMGTESNYLQTQSRLITADNQDYEIYASDDVEWVDADGNVMEVAKLGDTHRYQLVGKFHEQKDRKPRFAEIDKIIYLGPKK
jgi:hypothetical protein